MFQINATSNEIVQLVPKSFSEFGENEFRMVKYEFRKDNIDNHFSAIGKMVREGVNQ